MFNKLIAAGLTSIATSGLLTLILSIYAFFQDLGEDVYFSAVDLFLIYTVYSFPIILISGLMVGLLIKRILSFFPTSRDTFFISAVLYGLSGSLIALVLLLFNHEGNYKFSDLYFLLLAILLAGSSAFCYFWTSYQLQRKRPLIPPKK